MTFVVIGGGPTGVELAGAIAELATFVLSRDFRRIRPDAAKVLLLEGGERILGTFEPKLSDRAQKSLQDMGITVRTRAQVTAIDSDGVSIGDERVEATTVLWAAGVCASPLVATLGLDTDRQGRLRVEQDCSIPGHPDIFCIGDAAVFIATGETQPLPGVSPVAMQQGRFVARLIFGNINSNSQKPFHYRDRGNMATIGRSRAVARIGHVRLSGFVAMVGMAYVAYCISYHFRNRMVVLIDWAWSYFTYQRGSRLITGPRLEAGSSAKLPRG